MRGWAITSLSIAMLVSTFTGARSASDHYSPLAYRSKDGWTWESNTGLWVNPKPRYDQETNSWIHDTRIPSSTACCDKTGLWQPGDAANDFGAAEPEKKRTPQQRSRRDEPAKARKDTVEDQIEKVRNMGLPAEVEERAIERLRSGNLKPRRSALREALARSMREYEAQQEALANAPRPGVVYGRTAEDDSVVQDEPTRRHATVDSDGDSGALTGVGNFLSGAVGVAAALAPVAGAAAGLANARGAPAPVTTVRSIPAPSAVRSPTQYPPGPEYGRSTISGIK